MALKPNMRYPATVMSACLTESAQKGTPGISVVFETEEGTIEHIIWLTPSTVKRVEKDLGTLGADKSKLSSWTYLENLGLVIQGHECDITTFEEEYNGKKRIKVQWINERRKAGDVKLADRVAVLFGGKPAPAQPAAKLATNINDDDVPF
jgi:hypothetical protein